MAGPVDRAGFEPDAAGLSEAGAEIVESPGGGLRAIPVGSPDGSAFTCFLDGIQQAAVALYRNGVPIVYAYAGAVVRVRRGGRMSTLRWARGDAGSAGHAAVATDNTEPRGGGKPYVAEREASIFPFRYVDPDEVAAVAPGMADTEDDRRGVENPTKVNRVARDEIAREVRFLAGDASSRNSGETIRVPGEGLG